MKNDKLIGRAAVVLVLAAAMSAGFAAHANGHEVARGRSTSLKAAGPAPKSAPASDPDKVDEEKVLATLVTRSGLTEQDLKEMLANCNENQLNMGFCSMRGMVVAELRLRQYRDAKVGQTPRCAAALDADLRRWKTQRDKRCKARARGQGSMEGMVLNDCLAEALEKDLRRLRKHPCK